MQSLNASESSSQPQMDIEAVLRREQFLSEPRYGISLVAGRPFLEYIVEVMHELQSRLYSIAAGGLILPDPAIVHVTVLRGPSSLVPCTIAAATPTEVAAALKGVAPVTLAWSKIRLDPDGAIRAYTSPSVWPFSSHDQAQLAAEVLSRVFGVHVSVQRQLWATLGTLRASACTPDIINEVRALLDSYSLPQITVDRLKLLYYHDIQVASGDLLEIYELR